MDLMITTPPRGNLRRFIPTGRLVSQPNIFGLETYTIGSRHSQLRRLSLGSGATDIIRRFEEMKLEINEWRISAESQLISMKLMNERAENSFQNVLETSYLERISPYVSLLLIMKFT